MSPQEIANRKFFRFSGPPENWITAIKFMTWGLEDKLATQWEKIEAGDIFLMHSMKTNTIVKNSPSAVIGFGVVAPDFRRKDSPLWLEEIEQHKNRWPLLVPFSEIYLFSELRPSQLLEAPNGKNHELVTKECHELLAKAVPISEIFPKMGSMSSVKPERVIEIFKQVERFYLYNSIGVTQESYFKIPDLKKVDAPQDFKVRKPATLKELNVVKQKTIRKGLITYTKDLQALEKADNAHQQTLELLRELLTDFGYEIYSEPRSVDLFAIKNQQSVLFEIKSLGNKNFRNQARKGVGQLFEYEYFEVRKFLEEKNINTKPTKALIFSEEPPDNKYIEFIESLKIGVGHFYERKFQPSGQKQFLQI